MAHNRQQWPVRGLVIAVTLPTLVSSAFGIYFWFEASSMGEECRIDGCRTGFCFTPPTVVGGITPWSYCTHDCDTPDDCPKDFRCVQIQGRADPLCQKLPTKEFGEKCYAHEMCLSGNCQRLEHRDPEDGWYWGVYCIQPCGENNDCPKGGKCITSNDPPMCIPAERMKRDAERYYAMQKRTGMENIAHTVARQRREEHEEYLREHPEAREEERKGRENIAEIMMLLFGGDAGVPDGSVSGANSSSTSATADSPTSAPPP